MLTVLIATYNGEDTLADTLSSFCALDPPEGGWRLVIVDNGSTDRTPEILRSFSERLPLTCVVEQRRGKNVALNTGLRNISGDLVVFTDDDVLPDRGWLRQMRAAADSNPSFAVFGGPVEASWEVAPPEWLLAWVPLGPTYSVLPPMAEGPVEMGWVFGPNLAVRTSVFELGYRYDESIGPKGPRYPMGSETEFLFRLAEAGFKACHVREAVVRHMVRSYQMNMGWVLDRAVRFGRGGYRRVARGAHNGRGRIFGIPKYLVRMILVQGLRVSGAALTGNRQRLFRERWTLNELIGTATEARVMAEEEKRNDRSTFNAQRSMLRMKTNSNGSPDVQPGPLSGKGRGCAGTDGATAGEARLT